MKERNLPSL